MRDFLNVNCVLLNIFIDMEPVFCSDRKKNFQVLCDYIKKRINIDERDVVAECNNLLLKHKIFAGGSSGAVFSAIKQYFSGKRFERKPNVVTLFADRGDRYANTVYNKAWCQKYIY